MFRLEGENKEEENVEEDKKVAKKAKQEAKKEVEAGEEGEEVRGKEEKLELDFNKIAMQWEKLE